MKKNKVIKILIIFMSTIFLSGCWDIKDINKRSLPLVMGISKEDNEEYKLTLQIPIDKNENQIARIVTGKGETLENVIGQILTNSENAIDFSQIRLIVVHKSLANNEQEFRDLIKFLMGSEEIPSSALVALTDEKVENVLSNINDKLGVHASSLYDYFNKGAGWAPELVSTTIWKVYQSSYLFTKDIAVPSVSSGKDTVLMFNGSEILKQGKVIEKISPEESELINLLQNKNVKGKIENLGFASVIFTNSSIQYKASIKNNKPLLSSDLSIKINILEREVGIKNERIMKELEKNIKQKFYDLLEKTQKSQTDIFGFGQQYHHLISYNELKDWRNDYYPILKVNFEVHATIE
ncbi:Ger(x)C family spore germination protein [Bacillus suaedaesalsae]|uniref:Ger(X)C family spore germination protein n=1 Tax=Bacillus suaedaesalsae TaxID=2810349 RepID=A0ABS2DDZ3_9BACI|nr:Ger(x)C family spore germination protein [Bacillus suaedaesalsae]MBM6616689.1 Ger(x)C family spore germination protein [Bacillus suaedaesalsae]